MKFVGQSWLYLGFENRTSKKSGNEYSLAKIMDQETTEIYEMYVGSDKMHLIQKLAGLRSTQLVDVGFEMTSYKGNAQVDMIDIKEAE